jgi:flagellar FliL protein
MAKQKESEEKKSGAIGQLVVVLVLSVLAVGAGWVVGAYALKPSGMADHGEAMPAEPMAADEHGKAGKKDRPAHGEEEMHASAETALSGRALELKPITANIAAPEDVWVRLELAVLFADDTDEELAEQIHQDILAYIQTIKLYQVEGASGIRHFRRDINDLARIRSRDRVKGVLIRALLFE